MLFSILQLEILILIMLLTIAFKNYGDTNDVTFQTLRDWHITCANSNDIQVSF